MSFRRYPGPSPGPAVPVWFFHRFTSFVMKTLSLFLVAVLFVTGCDRETIVGPDASLDEALTAPPVTYNAATRPAPPVPRNQDGLLSAFMPAGNIGGGVLTPGTFFPPTGSARARLQRKGDRLHVNIHTTGLPPGAYTVWWVLFNNPDGCLYPAPLPGSRCGGNGAELGNPAAAVSVFWATGGLVQAGGVGNFNATAHVGGDLGDPGTQWILGDGLLDPQGAEVHMVIKYHGPTAEDRTVRYGQTHTILGSCGANANAVDLGPPFGMHCFDPQFAFFAPME